MKLRFVLGFLLLGCSTANVTRAVDGLQLQIVEFADHPDPNTGVPHAVADAQPWPDDLTALTAAADRWAEKDGTYVYDVRRDSLSPSTVEVLEETTATVIGVENDSARISLRMDGTPDPVEVSVPINRTVVLGSDKGDDRHAFVAVSVFDRTHADEVPVVYSPSDRSVTPPRVVTRSLLPLNASAREHHLKGTIVNAEIDEQGHIVAARVLGGRLLSADDRKAIEDVVRTWKFSPATRNGRPVRALMMIRADYDQSQTTSR